MKFRINYPSLSDISQDMYGRMDVDFFLINNKYNLSRLDRLRNYITFLESGKSIKASDYEPGTDNVHVTVRNIDFLGLNLDNAIYISEDKADSLIDYRLKKNDVVIAISSNCGCSFLYEKNMPLNLTLSHYLCRVRVNNKLLLEKYLVLFMKSTLCKDYFRSVETGKTIKNLAKYYISNMPIWVPSLKIQKDIVNKATPIFSEIKTLKNSITPVSNVIDSVLETVFNYDYKKFNSLKKKVFKTVFSQFGNNIDSRFSTKFHRPSANFVYSELLNRPNLKIKNCLKIPMITGQGLKTSDYDESGDYAYISMADIRSWELDYTNLKYVSNEYANRKRTKKIKGEKNPVSCEISKNDILMMRSGEGGIGKVALIKEDIKGIFCDFLIRIRFNEKIINPEFAYYFFRSSYFQYLVETNKKGLGNNTNIFPNQVQEFPIPDIPISIQKDIVKIIDEELRKQKEIEKQIGNLERDIESIINKALRTSDKVKTSKKSS